MGLDLAQLVARLEQATGEEERLAVLRALPPVLDALADQAVGYADLLKPIATAILATPPTQHMTVLAGRIGRPLGRAALNAKRVHDVRDALDHLVSLQNDDQADAAYANFLALYGGAVGMVFADFPRSIEMLARSFALAKRLGEVPTQMRSLNSVGATCQAAGIYTEAIRYYEECASLGESSRDKDEVTIAAIALGNLASSYLSADHPEEGLRALERRRALILIHPGSRIGDLAVSITECHLLVASRQASRARPAFDALRQRWTEMGEPAVLKPAIAMAEAALLESAGEDESAERTLVNAFFLTEGMLGDRRRLLEQLLGLGAVRADECRYAAYIHMLRETEIKAPRGLMTESLAGLRQSLSSMMLNEILEQDLAPRLDIGDATGSYRSASLMRGNVAISTVEKCALLGELNEDPEGLHPFRVGAIAALIAEGVGLNSYTVRSIRAAARLHDFGKAAVPKYLLQKPGPLTPNERRSVRKHSEDGMNLLADPQLPELQMAEEIAHYHHEWWNGTGYPANLAGRQIPVASRIVALADSYDSMTHHRAYRPAMTHKQAIEQMQGLRGVQFDPDYYDTFERIITKLHLQHGIGLDAFLAQDAKDSPFHTLRRQLSDQLLSRAIPPQEKDGSAGAK